MTFTSYRSSYRSFCFASILLFLLESPYAVACTTDAWNGGITGTPTAGSPVTVSRVSGLCGMQLTAPGSVKDTSPAAEPAVFIRFYVLAALNSGTPVIFEAFSDDAATSSLLTVTFDGTNFVFDAGAGSSGPIAGRTGWNMIELGWAGGVGMDFWVNTSSAEAPTGTISAAGGVMESVILGAVDSIDGTLTFDDYESHRDTPIGGLQIGDSNNDGSITLVDAIGALKEARIFNAELQVGSPDCNLDGVVNLVDAIRILQAARIFNTIPCGN